MQCNIILGNADSGVVEIFARGMRGIQDLRLSWIALHDSNLIIVSSAADPGLVDKQLLHEVFVISSIIKVEVSVISRAKGRGL